MFRANPFIDAAKSIKFLDTEYVVYQSLGSAIQKANEQTKIPFVDKNSWSTPDENGWTPLMYVTQAGNLSAVNYILQMTRNEPAVDVGLNHQNPNGDSAFLLAMKRANPQECAVPAKESKEQAITKNNLPNNNLSLNDNLALAQQNLLKPTALPEQVRVEILSAFLNAPGVKLDVRDKKNISALMLAVQQGRTDVVRHLVKNNVSVAGRRQQLIGNDDDPSSPLVMAVQKQNVDMVEALCTGSGHHCFYSATSELRKVVDDARRNKMAWMIFKNQQTFLSQALILGFMIVKDTTKPGAIDTVRNFIKTGCDDFPDYFYFNKYEKQLSLERFGLKNLYDAVCEQCRSDIDMTNSYELAKYLLNMFAAVSYETLNISYVNLIRFQEEALRRRDVEMLADIFKLSCRLYEIDRNLCVENSYWAPLEVHLFKDPRAIYKVIWSSNDPVFIEKFLDKSAPGIYLAFAEGRVNFTEMLMQDDLKPEMLKLIMQAAVKSGYFDKQGDEMRKAILAVIAKRMAKSAKDSMVTMLEGYLYQRGDALRQMVEQKQPVVKKLEPEQKQIDATTTAAVVISSSTLGRTSLPKSQQRFCLLATDRHLPTATVDAQQEKSQQLQRTRSFPLTRVR